MVGMIAWKASGIGPGKRFKKEELDNKYVQVKDRVPSRISRSEIQYGGRCGRVYSEV
jgi:hypothetical protein